MKIIFETDAIDLLNLGEQANLLILDPPYKLWDTHRDDLLSGAWKTLSTDSYLVCFCNPTVPDNTGTRRHDHIIRQAVAKGFKFKYEILWIRGNAAARMNHPSNRNTRVLVFIKGNPKLNKFCMEHERIRKPAHRKEFRGAGGVIIKESMYIPQEHRMLTDVLDQYIDLDTHEGDIVFYENNRSNSVNIGGLGIESKRIQSKPKGLMRTLIRAFASKDSTVMDPFAGSGTTGLIADELDMNCIMGDIDPLCVQYIEQTLRAQFPGPSVRL